MYDSSVWFTNPELLVLQSCCPVCERKGETDAMEVVLQCGLLCPECVDLIPTEMSYGERYSKQPDSIDIRRQERDERSRQD